ncbi:hypothetical protein C8F04DRAFT_1272093 [Mycena alexandri]|uniref:Uncharacterized protein n=1 Tax=Mycena alexandri TaxID=1745969 RepID=A0AAD6SCA6_9AGAR|nr:hypothetical protein C8F04DRAFT_1272093 [Mycena alexandri]
MQGLLRKVLDNKCVQRAGCSAFAALEEDAGIGLRLYLEPVLQKLVIAFDKVCCGSATRSCDGTMFQSLNPTACCTLPAAYPATPYGV